MKLIRLGPGFYRTDDDQWEISRGERGSSWANEWVVAHTRDRSVVSDPVPTLGIAREVLATMIAARVAGRI